MRQRCRVFFALRCSSPSGGQFRWYASSSRCEESAWSWRAIRGVLHRAGRIVSRVTIFQACTRSTYIASEYQVIDNTYNSTCCDCGISRIFPGIRKIDRLAILQQASREELVVDVQRSCSDTVRVDHGEIPVPLSRSLSDISIIKPAASHRVKSCDCDR